MKKQIKRMVVVALAVMLVWCGRLAADSGALQDELIRLHVVGASDSLEDQAVKLKVRDAVLASLEEGLADLTDVGGAMDYVGRMLPKVEAAANRVLRQAGFSDTVRVSLTQEAFPTRDYDTFSLPAGVYRALRVVIGEGEGRNWWCVVFPKLCGAEEFVETASVAGFSEELALTLEGEYEIRFWVLEKIGEMKNLLFDTFGRE